MTIPATLRKNLANYELECINCLPDDEIEKALKNYKLSNGCVLASEDLEGKEVRAYHYKGYTILREYGTKFVIWNGYHNEVEIETSLKNAKQAIDSDMV